MHGETVKTSLVHFPFKMIRNYCSPFRWQ